MPNATQARPTAPVKKARAPRTSFDVAALNGLKTLDALPASTRGGNAEFVNKLSVVIAESYRTNKVVALVVPAAKVKPLRSQLIRASGLVNLGVRVREIDAGNGNVEVAFVGKAKTTRKAKPKIK